jgi:hypothetical protein
VQPWARSSTPIRSPSGSRIRPRELQGRVFSIRRLIAWTILPVSTAIGGTLAGLLDPGYMLAVLGTIYALFSAAQLFNPYLLRVEDKASVDGSGVRH